MGTGATVREATISTAEPLGFSIKKGQLETIENFVVDEIYFIFRVAYWIRLSVSSWNIQQNFVSRTAVTALLL